MTRKKMYRESDADCDMIRTTLFVSKDDFQFCKERGGVTAIFRRMIKTERLAEKVVNMIRVASITDGELVPEEERPIV